MADQQSPDELGCVATVGGREDGELELRINGLGGRVCSFPARDSWIVNEVKATIETQAHVPAHQQRLLWGTAELRDCMKLADALGDDVIASGAAELTLVRRPPTQAEWLRLAGRQDPMDVLLGAPGDAWEDREVVLAAAAQSGWALQHSAVELRGDVEVVLAAVRQNGLALQHAAPELAASREVALAAVAHCGRALEFVSLDLRNDRDFVLEAVRINGLALKHAEQEFRGDREVVLAAVSQSGGALAGASQHLRADYEVVETAVRRDRRALVHATAPLRAEPELKALAERRSSGQSERSCDAQQSERPQAVPEKRSGGLLAMAGRRPSKQS